MKSFRVEVLILLLAGMVGCHREVRPRPGQNILLFTIDTLRADHLGCYGHRRAATPRIDRLAREGVLFEQAVAQVPVTLPSHASILTGIYPPVHGVRDNTYFRLDPDALTLAEHLRANGYRTAAFVGAYVLDASFGLGQGFDVYDDRVGSMEASSPGSFAERSAGEVVRAFAGWLKAAPSEGPFFAWIHFFDPHMPYAPPSPFRERFRSSPYDGEVAYTDQQVGVALDELRARGQLDDTLVVLTSDHGESLGEHGERTHGFFVYDATLRIPLILRSPRSLPAGLTVEAQVTTVDLAPTLLELAGVSVPEGVQGRSLVRMMNGEEGETPLRPAYAECYVPQLNFRWAPLVALRQQGFKYIDAPRAELYDLTRDPGETDNLVAKYPDRAKRMKEQLVRLLESWPESVSARHQPDPETVAGLRSLGYLGGGQVPEPSAHGLPDPKDRLHLWEKAEQVILHLSAGEYGSAAELAQSILLEDANNLLALELLANAYERQGAPEQAIALHRRILALDESRPLSHVLLGNLLWKVGELGEAEESFRAALQRDSRFPRAYERLGELYLSQGRIEAARESFAEALRLDDARRDARLGLARSLRAAKQIGPARTEYDRLMRDHPGDPQIVSEYAALIAQQGDIQAAEEMLRSAPQSSPRVHYTLSVILRAGNRTTEALDELDEALRLEPSFAAAHHDRGVILSRLGRMEEALPAFHKALELRDDPATRNALGTALCRLDRCGEAIPHFEKAVELAPRFLEALQNLGQAYRLAGRFREAEELERRAARLQ